MSDQEQESKCLGSDDGTHCGHWEEDGDCCDCDEFIPIDKSDCNCDEQGGNVDVGNIKSSTTLYT